LIALGAGTVEFEELSGTTRTAREPELSAVQRAGNRFGVAAVVFALLAALCTYYSELESAAWAFGPVGITLGGTGFVRWLNGEATNRDDALIGAGLAYLVLMVLFFRLAVAHPMPVAPMP
jgi:hypothetical protein